MLDDNAARSSGGNKAKIKIYRTETVTHTHLLTHIQAESTSALYSAICRRIMNTELLFSCQLYQFGQFVPERKTFI